MRTDGNAGVCLVISVNQNHGKWLVVMDLATMRTTISFILTTKSMAIGMVINMSRLNLRITSMSWRIRSLLRSYLLVRDSLEVVLRSLRY